MLKSIGFALGLFPLALASAGQAPARVVQAPEVLEAMRFVRSYTELGLSPEYRIQGEQIFDKQQVLAANVLVLGPGSRMVFAGTYGDRSDRYIVARTIVVLPGPSPVVTWLRDRDVSPSNAMLPPGKGAPGSSGVSEGADGGPGSTGQVGNPGFPGRSAPTIYVFASKIDGGPILVDLKGQDGGSGGIGQAGGDGASGRTGRPGISSVFDCRSGGGNGGNGGRGGAGGLGGPGGRGGSGGTFILLSPQRVASIAAQAFKVDIAAGKGGPGGEGGVGGEGGRGGGGGNASGLCQGGRPGADGERGAQGEPGQRGADGAPGVFAVTGLTDEQIRMLGLEDQRKK
jgi:hypothetical protein